jgi:2-C-methyl-D-erythritol 2,4-cyclodiphosphate synthase
MIRVGIGYDFHRLTEGRKLVLGGIEIPSVKGPEGHSDADVLLHSVCDALLGAAGEGDIGKHFPNNDERYKNISSKELLKSVVSLLKKGKWRINNVDVSLLLEKPKVGPFKERMKNCIGEIAGIKNSNVNIKATTTEGMDSIGKGEAVASQAVALIEKAPEGRRQRAEDRGQK